MSSTASSNSALTVWLIRHAKSDWTEGYGRDFERGLNARGQRDGARMQLHLASQSDPATWLWSSSANRAALTSLYVQRGFDIETAHQVRLDELYQADAAQLLDVLRRTPAPHRSVAVVAHNPGLTVLMNQLGPEPVAPHLPTLGIARFEFDCAEFRDIRPGAGRCTGLIKPKQLSGG